MRNAICAICIFLMALPILGESGPKYQVATITSVKPHQAQNDVGSDVVSYDVTLRVDQTIYEVLYKDQVGTGTVKYVAGRDLLVLVGEKTVSCNDILGRSLEAPIISKRPAADTKDSK